MIVQSRPAQGSSENGNTYRSGVELERKDTSRCRRKLPRRWEAAREDEAPQRPPQVRIILDSRGQRTWRPSNGPGLYFLMAVALGLHRELALRLT